MGKSSAILLLISIAGIVWSDDTNNTYEPCADDLNLDCVRKYFRENGDCSVINNVKDDLTYEMNLPLYTPSINLTSVSLKTQLSNIDGNITTFFIDKKSGNLVMTVDFKKLFTHSSDAIFAVSRNGKEPEVFKDPLNATYPVIITAVMHASNGITVESLKGAEYSANFHNSSTLELGPTFLESEDPAISAARKAFAADKDTVFQEIYQTKASFDFLVYLQNYVCDFGLAPVLEEYDTTVLDNAIKNDDDENNLYEPCAQEDNVTACVTNFFTEHGTCTPIVYSFEEPTFRSKAVFDVPKINSKVVAINFQVVGLSGDIDKFYINNQTGNLVLSASFEAITMISPLTLLVINQMGKPPKVIGDHSSASYPVTLTAVIPMSEGLTQEAIKKAYISAYITEPADIRLGSNFTESTDPQMISILGEVASDPITITEELLASEGPNFFIEYLQTHICDFQLPIAPF